MTCEWNLLNVLALESPLEKIEARNMNMVVVAGSFPYQLGMVKCMGDTDGV